MTWSPTEDEISEVLRTLSLARFQSYLHMASDRQHALELYSWNAQVSAALFVPIQFCEVSVRNAISDVLALVYGENWPWNPSFLRSLPQNGHQGENSTSAQLREIRRASNRQQVTGKVIADLKLSFWVHLMTKRYEARLWRFRRNSRVAIKKTACAAVL